MKHGRLILENGLIYHGQVFAKGRSCFGELIFNTAMSGYEEVLTDPSYHGQLVLMTYPMIGNYGINEDDKQSNNLHLQALIVKEYMPFPSNYQSKYPLHTYLESHGIMGIEGIDTRHITRRLRHVGALNAMITDSDDSDEHCLEQLQQFPGLSGKHSVKEVSTSEAYQWGAPDTARFKVAVIDCGVKFSILDQLKRCGCAVTVFPYDTPADVFLNGDFDGVLISNGPGDPVPVTEVINTAKSIVGKIPVFGICLGHQILCHAFGFEMTKLAFGHHGINHPIKNYITGQVEVSSQNHIYCATDTQVPDSFFISHRNLNDNTVAGIRSEALKVFSVQYHPEAAPGPEDSHYLFEEFTHLMTHQRFETEFSPSLVENT